MYICIYTYIAATYTEIFEYARQYMRVSSIFRRAGDQSKMAAQHVILAATLLELDADAPPRIYANLRIHVRICTCVWI